MKRVMRGLVALCLAAMASCHPQTTGRSWDQDATIALNAAAHGVEASDAALEAAFTHDAQTATSAADEAALEQRYMPAVDALLIARDALIDAERAVRDAAAVGDAMAECRARVALMRAADDVGLLLVQLRELHAAPPVGLDAAVAMMGEAAAVLLPQCPAADGGA